MRCHNAGTAWAILTAGVFTAWSRSPSCWAALAATEYLEPLWFDEISKPEAWDLAVEAFKDIVGWTTARIIGFKKRKYQGFCNATSFWKAVVEKFGLQDRKKRSKMRKDKVEAYCKKELIVLHPDPEEALLECTARVQGWAGEQVAVYSVMEELYLRGGTSKADLFMLQVETLSGSMDTAMCRVQQFTHNQELQATSNVTDSVKRRGVSVDQEQATRPMTKSRNLPTEFSPLHISPRGVRLDVADCVIGFAQASW